MKHLIVFILVINLNISYAFNFAVNCSLPIGHRIDFFRANDFGLTNLEFIFRPDKITGSDVVVFFGTNSAVLFLSDTILAGGSPYSSKFVYLIKKEEQITMIGLINEAPYMVSYFPKLNILYFSLQITDSLTNGAKAQTFGSKCYPPISKQEFNTLYLEKNPDGLPTLNKLNAID